MKTVQLGYRFEQAFILARELHAGQKRKLGRAPYVSHLLMVAAEVLENGGTEDHAIIALLHDSAEDQGGEKTLTRIEELFGADIASMVEACSDTLKKPKPPWRKRKETHLQRLRKAPKEVCLIMLADKLCNARSLLRGLSQQGESVWSHFSSGKEGTLWYYRQMHQLLSKRHPGVMADELDSLLEKIEHFSS